MKPQTNNVSSDSWTTIGEAEDGDVRLVLQVRREISLKPGDRDRVEHQLHGAIDEYVTQAFLELDLPWTTAIVLETRPRPGPGGRRHGGSR